MIDLAVMEAATSHQRGEETNGRTGYDADGVTVTHVDEHGEVMSDAGSTPAASTTLTGATSCKGLERSRSRCRAKIAPVN